MKLVDDSDMRWCTFCSKSNRDVAGLLEGRGGAICDECVTLCLRSFEMERRASRDTSAPAHAGDDRNAVVIVDPQPEPQRKDTRRPDREVWAALAPHLRGGLRIACARTLPHAKDSTPLLFFLERRRRGGRP